MKKKNSCVYFSVFKWLFCSSRGSEHLLMVIKSIWLQLLRIHVTKLSDALRRHTNGNSHLPFFKLPTCYLENLNAH